MIISSVIIYIQVTIGYNKPKHYILTPNRKKICKTVTRGSHMALARRCLENDDIRKCIISGVSLILRKEIATLCSNQVPSVLRDKSNEALKSFQWKCLLDELQTHAPVLLQILKSCTRVSRPLFQQEATIGVVTAILCKNRRSSASLIQRLISVILYSGHASKMVSTT